jgi:pyruvate/2-oxoglutarate dehydrogenase complex dihydrolipoamide dehydrogenase (E3) component
MTRYDVAVIGGGPAGVQAAVSARNAYPTKTIVLIRKEQIALIPCGIPYVIHSLSSVDDDILPDAMLEKNGIDLIIGEVMGRTGNDLILSGGTEIRFERLVVAAGSTPVKPKIPGIEKDGVHLVKKDYEYLKAFRQSSKNAHHVLVVGGGYIGVEMADEFLKAGKAVTLVEMQPALLRNAMDPEFGDVVQDELEGRGAEVITGGRVEEFTGDGSVAGVTLAGGRSINADFVVVSVGFTPNLSLAERLGVDVRKDYGVIVDEYMRTSQDGIFAAGDCATKFNCYTGECARVMLASSAMAQGRLAGANLYEIKVVKSFAGTLGAFATKVGDVALGVVGLTEQQAQDMGMHYVVGTTKGVDRHPRKLPNASIVHMKLLYARYSHTLLGAQMCGGDSVGEQINTLGVIIQNKMTDMEIDTLQIGTHPLLTSSPLGFPIINATVDSIMKWYKAVEN